MDVKLLAIILYTVSILCMGMAFEELFVHGELVKHDTYFANTFIERKVIKLINSVTKAHDYSLKPGDTLRSVCYSWKV